MSQNLRSEQTRTIKPFKSSEDLRKEYSDIDDEVRGLKPYNIIGLYRKEKRKKALLNEIKVALKKEQWITKQKTLEEIEIDQKAKPFQYFAAEKAVDR